MNVFPSKQEKETLLTQLNLLGAKKVYVEFRGGGDDGQVEGVYYQDKHDEMHDIPTDMIAWTKVAYGHQTAEQKETSLWSLRGQCRTRRDWITRSRDDRPTHQA